MATFPLIVEPPCLLTRGSYRFCIAKLDRSLAATIYLELENAQELAPQHIRNELETARRILAFVDTPEDKRRVEAYIEELHGELAGQIAASTSK